MTPGFTVTAVGVSGSFPGPDSPASCYLLEAEHDGSPYRILLDLGNGALGHLQKLTDALTIQAVFLSHLHADHCLDLCGYYVLRKYHPAGPQPRIPVWGPEDTARRMAKAYDLEEDPGMCEEFDFRTYPDEPITVGPFTLTARRVSHPVPAYALRVEAHGSVLAYSGDTGPCDGLIDTAREADLFLCEASFLDGGDNPPELHLTGSDAGRAATEAGAHRLVLTHIPPWFDAQVVHSEAKTTYDGPIELAAAGQVWQI